MNEELNKLNEKMLSFAGFLRIIPAKIDNASEPPIYYNVEYYIEYEDGVSLTTSNPPNFPESLDACFKWLVPKLYRDNYYYDLLQWDNGRHKAIISKATVEWAVTASDTIAETPALALCRAIEKLIDEGVND
jgi:hypothetical protein